MGMAWDVQFCCFEWWQWVLVDSATLHPVNIILSTHNNWHSKLHNNLCCKSHLLAMGVVLIIDAAAHVVNTNQQLWSLKVLFHGFKAQAALQPHAIELVNIPFKHMP